MPTGLIVYNTLDAHVVAVHEDGSLAWKTQVGNVDEGETTTMAPLIANGVVITGNSGGELGVRGWVKGLDLKTGRVLWTGYNSGPDNETPDGQSGLPSVLQEGPGQGLGRLELGARSMAARRRHGLGLDLVRPDREPHLLRHGESGRLECRPAARREQMVDIDHRAQPADGRGALGVSDSCRTTPGTTTRSWRTCSSTCPGRAGCASCSSIPGARASYSCSTA